MSGTPAGELVGVLLTNHNWYIKLMIYEMYLTDV